MPFNSSSLLILKHGNKSVVVPRSHCSSYDGTIAIAQRNFPSLQPFSPKDLVLEAFIPDYHDKNKKKEVEVSNEAWPLVSAALQSVTIAFGSGVESQYDAFCGYSEDMFF